MTIFILCDQQEDFRSNTNKNELIEDQIIISYLLMNFREVLYVQ